MTLEELRNAIANAYNIIRREGLTTMDYMEQLSWLLFLKSFEETENNLEAERPSSPHRELRELVQRGLIQLRGQGRMVHYISAENRTIVG